MNQAKLLFEKSVPGRSAWSLPPTEVPVFWNPARAPGMARATAMNLPELAEVDIVRHYTNLSTRNHGVDTGFYPLGSCTMKYNPKINENLANLAELRDIHPLAPAPAVQGALQLYDRLHQALCEITGMDGFTLQPAAGAHGELTALLMIRKYFETRRDERRVKILVPTSAHGTNPASAAMAGFVTVPVPCNDAGLVDLEQLQSLVGPDTAAIMLTNPNTLGLFEKEILQIASIIHGAGGLLYYDGANLNAIMGLVRPGDMGFDLVHLNLHKTFATPHGGGGPGAGPVGVKAFLRDYLPLPVLAHNDAGYFWDFDRPLSIGKVLGFYGNFQVLMKALAYIGSLGGPGLAQASSDAVLNANYLRTRLRDDYQVPYDRPCMHEFVLSAAGYKTYGIRALDIAKRLLDFGIHPPTIYFPLIVEEALMIEPTETEGSETLDKFCEIMQQIHLEAASNPDLLHDAPHVTPVRRIDETAAARNPKLRWNMP